MGNTHTRTPRDTMGKGRGEPCMCGRPIWGGVAVCMFICAIICFSVGGVQIANCANAQNDCKNDASCHAGCETGTITVQNTIYSINSDCGGTCFDDKFPQDCDSYSGTDNLACKLVDECQCSKTGGGLAGIIIGVIFSILMCVFCCGVVPCLCFDTGVSAPPPQGHAGEPPGVSGTAGVATAKI